LVKKTGYDVIDPVRTFPDGTGEKHATIVAAIHGSTS
jgi:hypothetical protein